MNQLESLARSSVLVADTGNLADMARFPVQDATTNPSLVLQALESPETREVSEAALRRVREEGGDARRQAERAVDRLFVALGAKILEIVPGRVSTEVPARLSFDTRASIEKAREIIGLYEEAGVERERVLVKLASTWEGIRAAEVLEGEGIHCNMTLLFSLVQAVAAAEAGATLISPFVGRIYDWYKKKDGKEIPIEDDPGVRSVVEIWRYLKHFDHPVQVMGASFRKAEQVAALAGCDLLTVSPDLLEALRGTAGEVPRRLQERDARAARLERVPADEESFRWLLNEDAMATEKLAEGIRRFHADGTKLVERARRELRA